MSVLSFLDKHIVMPVILACALFFWQAAYAVPEIAHWQTSNGARVYFVAAPELPIVDLRVTFDAGSARDDNKPGQSLLTNGLLAEGAGGLNADQIAEIFDS